MWRAGIGRLAQLVPHADLLPTAVEPATTTAVSPPLAVRAIKQGPRRALDPDWRELGAWVSSSLAELLRTEDHREVAAALLEKRPPRFLDR